MSSFYKRGNSLWISFKDARGKWVCRPSGYKIGQEAAVRMLLAELDRKFKETAETRASDTAAEPDRATAALVLPSVRAAEDSSGRPVTGQQPAPTEILFTSSAAAAAEDSLTVREWGERWLTTREHIETYADECGRLRNHVFPRIGDTRMRDVRPKHIRSLVLDLRKSNVHRRGTGQGLGTEKIAPRTVRHIYSLVRRMFSAAVVDEVIEASPVVVAKGVLPKNVDNRARQRF